MNENLQIKKIPETFCPLAKIVYNMLKHRKLPKMEDLCSARILKPEGETWGIGISYGNFSLKIDLNILICFNNTLVDFVENTIGFNQ